MLPGLSRSLQDYLETIFNVVRERKIARVRDLAAARRVRPGSVTPALKRLQGLGLVVYERREYVRLTPEGEAAARWVSARHQALAKFLRDVLQMPPHAVEEDACALEHNLSDLALDRLVGFLEYLEENQEDANRFLSSWKQANQPLGIESGRSTGECLPGSTDADNALLRTVSREVIALSSLRTGQSGVVRKVSAGGALRQRLLDLGILPGVVVRIERLALSGDPIWICLQGYQISLRREEAGSIQVNPVESAA